MLKKLFFYGVCLSTLAISACNREEEQEVNGLGTLSLRITDAPTDAANISGVFVTIDRIDYKVKDKWHTFDDFKGPKTYNLLDLTAGKSELLGDFKLEAGEYSELRFHLDAAENGGNVNNSATYVAFTDGSKKPLYVPSGTQAGYKATKDFIVPANGNVVLTADFDVRKSIVQTGSDGKWILKPVIRLVDSEQAGTITGSVANNKEGEEYIVFAFAEGSFTEDEGAAPAQGEVQFPNATSSAKVNPDGTYSLPYMPAGNYNLVIATYNNGAFGGVVGGKSNIQVVSQQSVMADLKF